MIRSLLLQQPLLHAGALEEVFKIGCQLGLTEAFVVGLMNSLRNIQYL